MNKRFWGLDELYRYTANNMSGECTDCNGSKPNPDNNYCVAAPGRIPEDVLTMVFINMQPLDSVYPTDAALKNGTLFPNLNKPFYGGMQR